MVLNKRQPLSKEAQLCIFRRDGWLCCWCKKPVIFAPAMRLLDREVRKSGFSGPLAYYHAHATRDGAPLLDELWAVLDHAEAFSTGGSNDEKNLVTACNKCNGRKSNAPLDEYVKRPKRKPIKGTYGEPQHWDGLSALFVALAQSDSVGLTASEKGWLKALTRSGSKPSEPRDRASE
jgi:5-methylcytosine-specific restriction endonuclease McrA